MIRRTEFSEDRRYRYTLWREFYSFLAIDPPLLPVKGNEAHNYLMVIGLNPSTADENKDDPTIRRCIGFAKKWGYGALCMTNLFAWRDTDPDKMKLVADPVGPMNDEWLYKTASGAGMILVAWGKHGSHLNRAAYVVTTLLMSADIHYLRLNKDGSPQHPLYIPADTIPTRLESS